jgi:hypothetical protein
MKKKAAVGLSCVFLFIIKMEAFPLSLKIAGGVGWISGGDLNRHIRGWGDYFHDRSTGPYSYDFDLQELHLWRGGGLEVLYSISPRFQVGLGLEYLTGSTDGEMTSSLEYEEDYFNSSQDFGTIYLEESRLQRPRYELRIIPLNLTLYYSFPFSARGSAFVGLGAGYYSGKLNYGEDYQYDFDYKDNKMLSGSLLSFVDRYATSGVYTEESRARSLGLHGKAGLRFRVYKNFCFLVEIIGRWAALQNWEGTKRDVFEWDHSWGFWGVNAERGSSDENYSGKLWMGEYRSDVTGESYPRFIFSEEEPSFSSYDEVRPARIDLSGISLKIGIRISL